MKNLIVLVDMDGTVADYEGQLTKDLNKLRSPNEPEIKLAFSDSEEWLEERKRLIKKSVGWWKSLPPITKNLDLVKRLHQAGFEIHIATKGPIKSTNAWTEKLEWCHEHLPKYIPDYQVHITFDKSLLYGKVLMDDYPPYAQKWLDFRPRGLVIMPDYEYNKDFTHPQVIKYNGENIEEVLERAIKVGEL